MSAPAVRLTYSFSPLFPLSLSLSLSLSRSLTLSLLLRTVYTRYRVGGYKCICICTRERARTHTVVYLYYCESPSVWPIATSLFPRGRAIIRLPHLSSSLFKRACCRGREATYICAVLSSMLRVYYRIAHTCIDTHTLARTRSAHTWNGELCCQRGLGLYLLLRCCCWWCCCCCCWRARTAACAPFRGGDTGALSLSLSHSRAAALCARARFLPPACASKRATRQCSVV